MVSVVEQQQYLCTPTAGRSALKDSSKRSDRRCNIHILRAICIAAAAHTMARGALICGSHARLHLLGVALRIWIQTLYHFKVPSVKHATNQGCSREQHTTVCGWTPATTGESGCCQQCQLTGSGDPVGVMRGMTCKASLSCRCTVLRCTARCSVCTFIRRCSYFSGIMREAQA